MKVVGFSGYSGSGKTTLVEQLIAHFKHVGLRVSVIKHAHHDFDIDQEGKDSWRHRQAGAYEVVIASQRRLAKMREFDLSAAPTMHELLAELSACDWVLVEGFKRSAFPKIEIWRAVAGNPAHYPDDPNIVALCTDSSDKLPQPTSLPVLDLNDVQAIATFLLSQPQRYEYIAPRENAEGAAADAR